MIARRSSARGRLKGDVEADFCYLDRKRTIDASAGAAGD